MLLLIPFACFVGDFFVEHLRLQFAPTDIDIVMERDRGYGRPDHSDSFPKDEPLSRESRERGTVSVAGSGTPMANLPNLSMSIGGQSGGGGGRGGAQAQVGRAWKTRFHCPAVWC